MTVTEQQTRERHKQEETRHKEQVLATLAVHPEMSDADIGAHIGCSRQFVNRMRRQAGIEAPTKLKIDPHEALYNAAIRASMTERTMLYEFVMDKVLADLRMLSTLAHEHHAQAVEDAINGLCVSMGKSPLETLLLVHEFLRNYAGILEHGGGK